jgi:alpha-tubulin suppressor-like RCC1 family protein
MSTHSLTQARLLRIYRNSLLLTLVAVPSCASSAVSAPAEDQRELDGGGQQLDGGQPSASPDASDRDADAMGSVDGGGAEDAPVLDPAVRLSTGNDHTCVLTRSGKLKCWGDNSRGLLGDGTYASSSGPIDITLAGAITSLSVGSYHTCAIAAGQLSCWGGNGDGQLGDGTKIKRLVPTAVLGPGAFISVTAGYDRTCAVSPLGAIYCWGSRANGVPDHVKEPTLVAQATVPVSEVFLHHARIYSYARTASGAFYEFSLGSFVTADTRIPNNSVEVALGIAHRCARSASSEMSCLSILNSDGQLGDGTFTDKKNFVPVSALGTTVSAIAAGPAHSCAISAGKVFCWGSNSSGQLGDGTATSRPSPTRVTGITGATALSLGSGHGCAILSTGGVRCWGTNSSGELGDGTTQPRTGGVAVVGF